MDIIAEEKLNQVKEYLEQHPGCSERKACALFGVNNVKYHRFRENGYTTKTSYDVKREVLKPLILAIFHADGHRPGSISIAKRLNEMGYECSKTLVLSLTHELGIANLPS